MSLNTWKDEFYPEDASVAASRGTKEALQHSINKWDGLREENLAKHKVKLDCGDVTNPHPVFAGMIAPTQVLEINAASCALCSMFIAQPDCIGCPLYHSRGNVRCDSQAIDEPGYSPFSFYRLSGSPYLMIAALQLAKDWLRQHPEQLP